MQKTVYFTFICHYSAVKFGIVVYNTDYVWPINGNTSPKYMHEGVRLVVNTSN